MRRGFTLLEVVMALLIMEVAVLGVLGSAVVANRTVGRAERLERTAARIEATLDSLRRGSDPGTAVRVFDDVRLSWSVDSVGRVDLEAIDQLGRVLASLSTRVPVR